MKTVQEQSDFALLVIGQLTTNEPTHELTKDDKGHLLEIIVAKEDMGRVIGKGGANIGALRLLTSVFARGGEQVAIKVKEPA